MPLLPTQGGSNSTWGTELNNVILVEHNNDGTHKLPREFQIKVIDDTTVLATGDGQAIMCIPASLNGKNLTGVAAFVTTNSSSGLPTIQVRRIRAGVNADMLSTRITIDANEPTSYTAAAAAVINATNQGVQTGDLIAIDVDVTGTGTKGLGVILIFS